MSREQRATSSRQRGASAANGKKRQALAPCLPPRARLLGHLDDDLQRARVRRMTERLVRLPDIRERKTVRDQLLRVEPSRADGLQQHRRARRVDEPGRDRDVTVPQRLEMQIRLHAVHADVGDHAARRDDPLAQLE